MKICSSCKIEKELSFFHKRSATSDGYYGICKSCRKIESKEYYEKYKEKIIERVLLYEKNNIEKCRERKKIYAKEHREELNAKRRLYENERLKEDTQFRLSKSLRRRLRDIFNGGYKLGSAIKDIGCTMKEFMIYLESKFYPNIKTGEMMSWKNYGIHGWHIDHIRPLASFDLTDRKQFLQAVHYTNLQPMWAEENLKKKAKLL